jgi:hypothetical protein
MLAIATASESVKRRQSERKRGNSAALNLRRRLVACRLSRFSTRLGRPMFQGRPAHVLECFLNSRLGVVLALELSVQTRSGLPNN